MGKLDTDDGDEDRLKWIHDELKRAADSLDDWRDKASECYDFYAAEHWSEDDRYVLENERGRQAVTFDRVTRTINAVSGVEVQNRQEIRYYPREIGDAAISEIMTNAVKWAKDRANADHEESESFLDVLISGMGWIHISLDADSKEPELRIDRIDPLECLWDPSSRKRNLSDSKWRARIRAASSEEIEEQWPDADMDMAAASTSYLDYSGTPRDVTPPRYDPDREQRDQAQDRGYEVVEFHFWEYEPYYQVLTQDGGLAEFSVEQWATAGEDIQAQGLQFERRRRKVYWVWHIAGDAILQKERSISQDDFTLQAITGLRNRNENTWFGLMLLMLDPQRWANKWLSQILHIVNSNAKGGLLAEVDAFEDVRQAETSWAMSDSITWIRSGGLAKIQERSFGQLPAGVDRLLQYAMEAINSVSGVNVEMMGLTDRDQPGVVEESRKKSGITIVSWFFDALRLYYKTSGLVLVEIIRKYISDGRLIRVVGDAGAQYVPLMRDQFVTDYDVVVDESPTSPNVKDKTFIALMQIIPLAMQAGIKIPPEILEYAPLPSNLIQKWKEQLQPPPPDPEKQAKMEAEAEQAKQMALAGQQAAIAEMQSKAQLNTATAREKNDSLQLDEHKLKIEGAKMGFEAQMEKQRFEQQAELERMRAEHEHSKLQLQAAQFGFEAQIKKEEHQHKMALEKLKIAHEKECLRLKMMEPDAAIEFMDGGVQRFPLRDMMREESSRNMEAMAGIAKAMQELHGLMKAPRRRELARDKKGRATHAIETIIIEGKMPDKI